MISIRDYAGRYKVSYESIRKQVARYEDELGDHIQTVNRTRYLDEYAQKFLQEKRAQSPIVVLEESKNEELETLRQQVENLRTKLLEDQERIILLQESNMQLMEDSKKYAGLLESISTMERRVQEYQELQKQSEQALELTAEKLKQTDLELSETKERLADAETEARSYHKTIFGFYRKK